MRGCSPIRLRQVQPGRLMTDELRDSDTGTEAALGRRMACRAARGGQDAESRPDGSPGGQAACSLAWRQAQQQQTWRPRRTQWRGGRRSSRSPGSSRSAASGSKRSAGPRAVRVAGRDPLRVIVPLVRGKDTFKHSFTLNRWWLQRLMCGGLVCMAPRPPALLLPELFRSGKERHTLSFAEEGENESALLIQNDRISSVLDPPHSAGP